MTIPTPRPACPTASPGYASPRGTPGPPGDQPGARLQPVCRAAAPARDARRLPDRGRVYTGSLLFVMNRSVMERTTGCERGRGVRGCERAAAVCVAA